MVNISDLQKRISKKFTQDVLDDILRKKFGSTEIKIKTIILGNEGKKGDSYLSTVTRFTVEFTCKNESGLEEEKSIHIIAKALLNNICRRKTFRSTDFFENEISFYDKVWPALDAFQKSKNASEPFTEIPTCLASYSDGKDDYFLLEDLCYIGYRGAEKSSGLDVDHVHLILRVFARFHALSFAYRDQNPDGFKKIDEKYLKETYFAEHFRWWYEEWHFKLKEIALDAVKKELPESYYNKFHKLFSQDVYGISNDSCAQRGPLTVVTHGDAWIPNFLIRYDGNGKPLQTKMIDFQLTRVSSLSGDIQFFLYACTDSHFLKNNYDAAIEYYCKEFNIFAKDLGTDAKLTKERMFAEFKEIGAYSMCMSTEGLVMSLLDDDEVSDLDALEGDEAVPIATVWIIKPLKTQEKRLRLASFVKHAVDNGFI